MRRQERLGQEAGEGAPPAAEVAEAPGGDAAPSAVDPRAVRPAATLRGVGRWVADITEQELPLFAQNLSEISSVASARQSSAADLAQAITMDVSMSVRLLKVANSPMLNPQDRDIDSVRTAVVLMGFDAVRDLAFSLSLVSELHRDGGGGRVVELLAHGLHTAAIAQALARIRKDRYPEETFVAGLLLKVGEMAFWSRERRETRDLEQRLEAGEAPEQAEKSVLGFTLRDLSRRLAEEWRMSGLLRDALSGAEKRPRSASLLAAEAAATTAERHGWDSAEGKATLDRLAEELETPRKDLEESLREATRAATKMARRFGVTGVERVLSKGVGTALESPAAANSDASGDRAPAASAGAGESGERIRTPDPQAELTAVRDLQAALQDKPDIDRLMRLALQGLYTGAGVDRAFFAMLSPERTVLRARYAAGGDAADVLRECEFRFEEGSRHLFAILLKSGKTLWVNEDHRSRLGDLIGADVERWSRGQAFFAMPIFIRQRPVGLLYADRAASGRELDEAAFTSFRFFGGQISAGLARR